MPENPQDKQKLAAIDALLAKLKSAKAEAVKMKTAEDSADAAAADAEQIIKTEAK
jgi:hypothetical protein